MFGLPNLLINVTLSPIFSTLSGLSWLQTAFLFEGSGD